MRTRIPCACLGLLLLWLGGCAADQHAAVPELRPPRPARTAPTGDEHQRLSGIAAARAEAVVEIRTEYFQRDAHTRGERSGDTLMVVTESGGTGVVIDRREGLVLTNTHVVAGADRIFVRFNRREFPVRAWRPHESLDLALLVVGVPAPAALEPRQVPVDEGVAVVALSGVPEQSAGAFGVVTRRSVSLQATIAPEGPLDYRNLIECTAPLRPGFSGGPVFSLAGEWVGISVAAAESTRGPDCRGYMIPLDEVTRGAILGLVSGFGRNQGPALQARATPAAESAILRGESSPDAFARP